MATQEDILDIKVDEAPRPGLCPGTFHLVIKDFEKGESSQKQTPYIRFKCGVRAAQSDVKREDLARLGDIATKVDDIDFYLTDNSIHRLGDFMEKALKIKVAGRTFRETIPESVGKEFLATYENEEINRREVDAAGQSVLRPTGEFRARAQSFAPVK